MHIGISSANGSFIQRLDITGANTYAGRDPDVSGARLSLSRASRDADHKDVQRLHTTDKDREFYVVRTDPSLFAAANAGENTDYRRDGRLYTCSSSTRTCRTNTSPISTYDTAALPDEYAASPLAAAAVTPAARATDPRIDSSTPATTASSANYSSATGNRKARTAERVQTPKRPRPHPRALWR